MATVLYQSATIGLMAVSVALLMIGGEFDLSSGVAVVTGVDAVTSIFAVNVGLNLFVSMALALGMQPVDRLLQRVAGHQDRDPQLPDHAQFALHAVRYQPRVERNS